MKNLLENSPIIAAVKSIEDLEAALLSDIDIIFLLFGSILTISNLSELIEKHNKIGIIHMDLIDGLQPKDATIKYLVKTTKFRGIISTKHQLIKSAKENGLFTIQRIFIYDTLSLNNATTHISAYCDALEVLPGVIPKVIKKIHQSTKKPVIAGGLIEEKDEAIRALNQGAIAISTTKQKMWKI